jgi:hypothetical protein
LDNNVNGLIVDCAPANDGYRTTRVGNAAKLNVEIDRPGTVWRRIAVSASLPGGAGNIIIQLADAIGSCNFAGGDVALLFQAPMVEAGGTASAWSRPPAELWLQEDEQLQGDGVNLLAGADEKSMQLAGARIELDGDNALVTDERVFRLVTSGESGEHYAVMSWAAPVAGQTTFSIYVHRSSAAWVRLQLLDNNVNGFIVDYALASDTYRTTRVGTARKLNVEVDKSSTDWRRIAVSALLTVGAGNIIIQLADTTGSTNFAGGEVALLFQAPMVEAGGTASAWRRPSA